MKISTQDFRVRAGGQVSLKKLPTRVKPFYASSEDYQKMLAAHIQGKVIKIGISGKNARNTCHCAYIRPHFLAVGASREY